ncbi:MAG TPA: LuxR C-terminal-related transcriptional regulator [Acidimicrobiales bacterium]|nr:LuxR C-terminal-related transcriptional regulator [Acidimicrobiales bacterium]
MSTSNLTRKDLLAVLDIVSTLNNEDGEALSVVVLAEIQRLVGSESIVYTRAELTTGQVPCGIAEPVNANVVHLRGFQALVHQHPVLAAFRTGRAALNTSIALSDLANLRTLRRLPLYVEFNEPYGFIDQLLWASCDEGPWIAGLVCNRPRRGFSDRDRAVLDLVGGHLSQAVARRRRVASLTATVRRLSRHGEQIEAALPRLAGLTERERQVVEHLVGGLTDRETARSLAISPRMVHKHLENIYRKLGLTNRTSVIAAVHGNCDTHSDLVGLRCGDPRERLARLSEMPSRPGGSHCSVSGR